MARKQFTVVYPDGSKAHIGTAERESLLLARQIRATGNPSHFIYVGEVRRFHSFAELGELQGKFGGQEHMRRFLAGTFTVESPDGSRRTERLETPEGFIDRLTR